VWSPCDVFKAQAAVLSVRKHLNMFLFVLLIQLNGAVICIHLNVSISLCLTVTMRQAGTPYLPENLWGLTTRAGSSTRVPYGLQVKRIVPLHSFPGRMS